MQLAFFVVGKVLHQKYASANLEIMSCMSQSMQLQFQQQVK
jgi:hypothetical protein